MSGFPLISVYCSPEKERVEHSLNFPLVLGHRKKGLSKGRGYGKDGGIIYTDNRRAVRIF